MERVIGKSRMKCKKENKGKRKRSESKGGKGSKRQRTTGWKAKNGGKDREREKILLGEGS